MSKRLEVIFALHMSLNGYIPSDTLKYPVSFSVPQVNTGGLRREGGYMGPHRFFPLSKKNLKTSS